MHRPIQVTSPTLTLPALLGKAHWTLITECVCEQVQIWHFNKTLEQIRLLAMHYKLEGMLGQLMFSQLMH
jgi:hypothetical protein